MKVDDQSNPCLSDGKRRVEYKIGTDGNPIIRSDTTARAVARRAEFPVGDPALPFQDSPISQQYGYRLI